MFGGEDSCCGGPAAIVLGLFAAGDLAMDGNNLKLAVACRMNDGGSQMGSLLELKVRDRLGAAEPFENARLDVIPDCDEALISGAAAVHELVSAPVSVWRVSTETDARLCEILDGQPDFVPRPLLMRALEETASRRLTRCLAVVERLAMTAPQDIALRAIAAMGRIGDHRSIMVLGRLTLSKSPMVPWAATQAIADIGGQEAIKALDIIAGQSQTRTLAREAADLADRLRKEYRQP